MGLIIENAEQALAGGQEQLVKGNLSAVDQFCHYVLATYPADPQALALRHALMDRLNLREDGAAWAQTGARPGPRYLLIKAWGAGFWSDMTHVLACLLLAEITGRTPVVRWGVNSLFRKNDQDEAFSQFWRPVSSASFDEVVAASRTGAVFPTKWMADNLKAEDFAKWEGDGSRLGGVYYLNRPEAVAVSDFYIGLVDLLPWIPSGHPLHGKSLEDVYLDLARRYLEPCALVRERVEAFKTKHFGGGEVLAVHIRGSDKQTEFHLLAELNQQYFPLLDAEQPATRFFVMTDDLRWLDAMRARYGERVLFTWSQRTINDTGPHFQPDANRVGLGYEVMVDTYLALECDRFLGNGRSTVSNMIFLLKEWPKGTCQALSPPQLYWRNGHLHLPEGGAVWNDAPP